MTDWYKIKRVLIWQNWVEKQIYPAQTVQTFDFQNNWALGWTGYNIGYGTPDYVTGQGWNIWASSSQASYQWWITIPNSVFQWELKSIKIYRYKPGATTSGDSSAVWIWNQNESNNILYSFFWGSNWWIYVSPWWTRTGAIDPTWEITTEFIMESNWNVTVDINGTTYNVGSYASTYKNLWTNKALYLIMWRWDKPAHYIRKVEITTA